jgi:hypothetical protein
VREAAAFVLVLVFVIFSFAFAFFILFRDSSNVEGYDGWLAILKTYRTMLGTRALPRGTALLD